MDLNGKFFNGMVQVKRAFCSDLSSCLIKKCSSDLKNFANSWPSASNFKSFSQSIEQFFLTVGKNNFGNKIPKMTLESSRKLSKKLDFDSYHFL